MDSTRVKMVNVWPVQMHVLLVQTAHIAKHALQDQLDQETHAHVQMELISLTNQQDTVKDVNKVALYAIQMELVYNAFQIINSHPMVNAFVVLENSQPHPVNVQLVPVHNALHAKTPHIVWPVFLVTYYKKANAFPHAVKDIIVTVQIV